MKKLLSILLALCLTVSLLTVPALAVDISTFPDISDPTVGEAVESLRMMGVLNGVGQGKFNPLGTLTRAEFCKMAVLIMGLGDQVPAYENRTIFPDVAYNHWARGYINLAVNTDVGGSRLILGVGDGTFAPARIITYAEAVTVLLRLLGYGEEANKNWPTGAVNAGKNLGLSYELGPVSATSTITRAQAAILFRNTLTTVISGGTDIYAASLGSVKRGTVLVSSSVTTSSGRSAVELTGFDAPVGIAGSAPADFFLGKRGTAVLDKNGLFLTLLPEESGGSRTITVDRAAATYITGTGGEKITVSPDVPVMYNGAESTYTKIFSSLDRPGLVATVYFTRSGDVDYIYVEGMSAVTGRAAIAEAAGYEAFASIIGGYGCYVVRNGSPATLADIRRGDVGMYDAGRNTLYVTDFRVSAVYEKASPNPMAPTSVRLFGKDFAVADCALDTIQTVNVGDVVVASFTPDGRIAKLAPYYRDSATALAVVSASSGSNITLELINAPTGMDTISGVLPDYQSAGELMGHVLTFSVSRGSDGKAVIEAYYAPGGATTSIDIASRRMGSAPLSSSCAVFERVGYSGGLARTSLSELNVTVVPSYNVLYAHYDTTGAVDVLVLSDVTGDGYVYGLVTTRVEVVDYEEPDTEGGDPIPVEEVITTVTNSKGSVEAAGVWGLYGGFGGLALSGETVGNYHVAAGWTSLNYITGVRQDEFSLSYYTMSHFGITIPISPDVQCYDSRTGTWFSSLEECLVYSTSFTVYYDRDPADGGKIRIITV